VAGRRLTVRAIALLGAGSAAVHQLRYGIGFGNAAPHVLAAHGHGYLAVALPAAMTAALIALAAALQRVAGAPREGGAPQRDGDRVRASLAALWLAAALALALIYGVQETLEGSGAFTGGGWIGLALAIPAGLLVALALRGADAAEALRARGPAVRVFVVHGSARTPRRCVLRQRLTDLRLGARAPPLSFVV
jgi:hypothetical protein